MSTPTTDRQDIASTYRAVVDALVQLGGGRAPMRSGAGSVNVVCPAHEDRAPSLEITLTDARILIRCHSTDCAAHDPRAALAVICGHLVTVNPALVPAAMFAEPPRRPDQGKPRAPRASRPARPAPAPRKPAEPVCLGRFLSHRAPRAAYGPGAEATGPGQQWFPYYDGAGTLVAWHVRCECTRAGCSSRASYPWRYPTRGGISANPADRPATLPLYRLPDIRAAIEAGADLIDVCEGESDAEAVTAAGGIGCTSGNSGSWGPEHTQALTGARGVRVWADNDNGDGHKFARLVRDQLAAAGIPVRAIVRAADGHKDAREHLEAGLSLADAVDISAELADDNEDQGDDDTHQAPAEMVDIRDHQPTPGRGEDGPSDDYPPDDLKAAVPGPDVPMSRGMWCYATGTGPVHPQTGKPWPRGVYYRATPTQGWRMVAPLPYVLARTPRRGSNGRRLQGDDLILSAGHGALGHVISPKVVRDGSWADILGLVLSLDDKIAKAAGTAIAMLATGVPEQEPILYVDGSGHLVTPLPDVMPGSYLRPSPEDGWLQAWRDRVEDIAASPKIAFALGGSMFSPFKNPLGRDSHLIDMEGDAAQGKSTTIRLSASLWGDPRKHRGVVKPFNTTRLGAYRWLGALRTLPAFFDEGAIASWGPEQWGEFIFTLTEGVDRTTATNTDSRGIAECDPWDGVFFRTGNGAMTEGLGAGKYSGTLRRVISLDTPLTIDRDHSDRLKRLAYTHWGHLGPAVLKVVSVPDMDELIARAGRDLPRPTTPIRGCVADALHDHMAGAAALDRVLGTGDALYEAARRYAATYLENFAEPQHDADRVISWVMEAISREPALWPTLAEYREHLLPRPEWTPNGQPPQGRAELAQHGVDRHLAGIVDDDGQWVAIYPATWKAMRAGSGISENNALRELYARKRLILTAAQRARGDWMTLVQGIGRTGGPGRAYRLTLDLSEADDPGNDPGNGSDNGSGDLSNGSGNGSSNGSNPALTSEVTDVTGGEEGHTRTCAREGQTPEDGACPACGQHVAESIRDAFGGYHPLCAPDDTREAGLEAVEARRATQEPQDTRQDVRVARGQGRATRAARGAQAGAGKPGRPEWLPARLRRRGTEFRDVVATFNRLRALQEQHGRAVVHCHPYPTDDAIPQPLRLRGKGRGTAVHEGGHHWTGYDTVPAGTRVVILDRNKAYCAALGVASLPIAGVKHYDGQGPAGQVGIHRVDVWPEQLVPGPHPWGQPTTDRNMSPWWITTATLQLGHEAARDGLITAPVVVESWTAPPLKEGRAATARWEWMSAEIVRALAYAQACGDSELESFLKVVYSTGVSTAGESGSNTEIWRPELPPIIRSTAAANLWRPARKLIVAGLSVVAVTGTDEIHVAAEPAEIWAALDTKGRPVVTEGRALNQIKVKGGYVIGADGARVDEWEA